MTARFALITDTTADLSTEITQKYNIYMIPQVIVWGREILKDGISISSPQFYQRLKTTPEMPTTSRPAPVDVADLYRKAMEETGAEAVVVLTVSQDVSGTYPSAIEAQKMVDFPVHVLDTRTITLALGMTTMKVAEARDQGATVDEALDLARTLAANSHVLFSPGTLEFLRRGGRIGAARHLLGTALSIKPILHVRDGHVEALESIRTRKKALKRMIELTNEQIVPGKPLHVGIIHGDAAEEAAELIAEARALWNPTWLLDSWVSPSIGVHAGPGVIGVTLVQ